MISKNWRFELFYWDLIIGILLMGILSALTLRSIGHTGRGFFQVLQQADPQSILFAILAGLLLNMGNLLLVAVIATAGMSVAFPIGGGIAWILSIILNYLNTS